MEIQLENPSPVKKIVNITVPGDKVTEEFNKEYQKIKRKVSIKGFRKGKVPMYMIKKLYESTVAYEIADRLINESVKKAIEDNNIAYIEEPEVKEVSELNEGRDFKLTVEFYCIEDFDLKDYKGIEVEVKKIEVTEDMINSYIEKVLKRFTYFEDIEDENTPIAEGYQVVAEIEAILDGEKLEQYSKEEIVLTIGENFFLPGFDDYFIGLTKNDETEVTHPVEIDGEEREVTFKIKVKWIKKPVVPELDEEFISQFGEEYESVEAFKEKVRKELEKTFKAEERHEIIGKILSKLREIHKFQVPDFLIKKQLEYNKKTEAKYPEEDDEAYEKRIREISENQIYNSVIINRIGEAENIDVTKEDIDKRFEQLAKPLNINKEVVQKYYSENSELFRGLFNQVLGEKVFDFLIENAKINYVDKDEKDEENLSEKVDANDKE